MEEDASEGKDRSNFSTSEGESDTSEETKSTKKETPEAARSLSNEIRERLCLKTELAQSDDIALHPVLVTEWMNWMRKGLYEGEEDDYKK